MVLMYYFETVEWAGCGGRGGSQGGEGVEQVGVIQQKIVVMNTQCHPSHNSPQHRGSST